MSESTRILLCPICGQPVVVPSHDDGAAYPITYTIPDHRHGPNGNWCQLVQVSVVLDLVNCQLCGERMTKHKSGLCIKCFEPSKGNGK